MKQLPTLLGALLITSVTSTEVFAFNASDNTRNSDQNNSDHYPGGDTTYLKKIDKKVFLQPAANISFEERMPFNLGNSLFKKLWVSSPSSTTASDGLGPLYNARSCRRCHVRDGRGHTPDPNNPADNAVSMMLKLSIPPQTDQDKTLLAEGKAGVIPEPTYGTQLQDFGVPGLAAEGRFHISYSEVIETFPDGYQVTLRKPEYHIEGLNYGDLHPDTLVSPRIAPQMIGLGLLEAIPAQAILDLADPDDTDQNGISGKANFVWDVQSQSSTLGRFGWKAGSPNLMQQNNSAFLNDIGISTRMFSQGYGECTDNQTDCLNMPDGNSPHLDNVEASDEMVQMVEFYTRHLAVPKRRNPESEDVVIGKQLFYQSGCAQCHQPSFVTSETAPPALAQQKIWPYTDMLLHDMGEELTDHRPEFKATGREWRTPPLWGIGLTELVSGHTQMLHDGRARNIEEAILWHGGEAYDSKVAYKTLSAEQRKQLIQFVESL